MTKSMETIEAEESKIFTAKVSTIKELNSRGNETATSGKTSAANIGKELKEMIGLLLTFKTSLDAEVANHGNKESSVTELNVSKAEIKKLQTTFKESCSKCSDLKESIKKDKEAKRQDADEIARLKAKIAAKTKEMEKENLEFQEREKELDAQIEAIEEELFRKKRFMEAELANPTPNFLFEGGEQSRSFLFDIS
uniref:Uncharacterized protein n=1 Tax=Panagrolaimus superbus TaxID=310955 RepID=A0A914Z1R4_9BILA